jgi:hypothetical protein
MLPAVATCVFDKNSASAHTDRIQQSNDFTDLGSLEANLWFIGRRRSARCTGRAGRPWRPANASAGVTLKARSPDRPIAAIPCRDPPPIQIEGGTPVRPKQRRQTGLQQTRLQRNAPWSRAAASHCVLPSHSLIVFCHDYMALGLPGKRRQLPAENWLNG